MAEDVEPELTLAVDAMFPMPLLMESLKALRGEFPRLPATLFTEALGGAEQRLREGAARLAIYTLPGGPPPDLSADFLTRIGLVPVVAASHPLAYVQLVLTDRTEITRSIQGGIIGQQIWRFADLSTRLEFLLGGFGWCNMPLHMVEDHILAGRLKRLAIAGAQSVELPISLVHQRGRSFGRASRWFIDDLRVRLKTCPGAASRLEGPASADLVA
jgi:DNA-binding transcriptional LysR family regulator